MFVCLVQGSVKRGGNRVSRDRVVFPRLGTGYTDRWRLNLCTLTALLALRLAHIYYFYHGLKSPNEAFFH